MGQRPPFESSESEANAAFIVRACNNHDRLVKVVEGMLREADRNTDPCIEARAILKELASG